MKQKLTEVDNLFPFQKLLKLDSTRLIPSCETQRVPIEMVKMSKIHTHHTEKDNSRDGSFKKFRKLNLLTFYKRGGGRGGGSTYVKAYLILASKYRVLK